MRLFNDGWEFRKQKIGTGLKEMKERDSEFVQVGIPHDWLIGQTILTGTVPVLSLQLFLY